MVKFRIPGLSIFANQYKAPSGNVYRFTRDGFHGDNVTDPADIEYFQAKKEFLEEGKGAEIPDSKTKAELNSLIKDNLKKPKSRRESFNLSKEDICKLNKSQQIEILKNLGAIKIPTIEKERADLILKLQEE